MGCMGGQNSHLAQQVLVVAGTRYGNFYDSAE